jgi:hypothetical protein
MITTVTILRMLPRSRPLLLLLAVLFVLAATAAVIAAAFHGAPVHLPAGAMSYSGKPGMSYS